MSDNQLVDLSKEFAVNIINSCEVIRSRGKATAVIGQLLRCGTSIGANIHEGNYASSRADFVNKFQIALKECFETDYWLEVFNKAGMIDKDEYVTLVARCSKIRRLLIASLSTAKTESSSN